MNLINSTKKLLIKNIALINYIFFGVLTTAVNLGVFWLASSQLHLYYLLANLVAWFLSVVFAFFTNKYFVFKSRTTGLLPFLKEFLLFLWMRVLSGVFDMGSMFVMVSMIKIDDVIAKVLTQFVIVILNYTFSKAVIFKDRGTK
ncbi:GtrA family protein [Loigolactobacillus zhaoyuanensis]|uniref:GtrA family protein n=1 Tax=Loigolactobacillus zhaoyuanensis TaxID=2486017 RepID=UPI000F73C614|nr:GtrA family protein [Loigolactobacillus zhaoyuanensis]